jgi:Leucine-rich repeat (LRR) protein
MKLVSLDVSNNPIADLRPLKDMRALRALNCASTRIADLVTSAQSGL